MNLYEKSASELGALLRSGACSAVEITKDHLRRIGAVEDKIGAYITLSEERALQQAEAVDKKIAAGETLHPLAGVPIALKDNLCTQGIATTCASKMLEGFVPPYNATVVSRLDTAGAVTLGKLNLDEFAMGSSCESSAMKITRNPWNTNRVPGGSSGGSAAAVAACEAVLTLGSDTGGSIRLPSAYCGVVGLKPTYGSVSRYGLVAFASSLDQIGPMGRTVEDVALCYGAICGHDPLDATSARRDYPDFTEALGGGVHGLTIGLPDEYFGEGISAKVRQNVLEAVAALEAEGATIRRISLPSTPHALSAYYIVSSAEASSNLSRFDGIRYGYRAEGCENLNELFERSRSEGFGPEVKRRIMLGTFVLTGGYYDDYYGRGRMMQQRIAAEFSDAFEECDLIITPTAPTGAFELGANIGDPLKMYATDVCTVTVNIAGLPALSLPCGFDENQMPTGLQLIGPKFSEARLFGVAHHYEKLCGGFKLPGLS
jgi:aspartyl-tRNA(Asn)/glutamyl-tRNA(Gln) amidotransferase subunit A